MKIKALWGFHGDASKLKAETSRVVRGQEFDVSDEYGHALIGQGLAEEVSGKDDAKAKAAAKKKAEDDAKAKAEAEAKANEAETTKQAAPKENK